MRRRLIVAFAIVASLLVVTATPAAASHGVVTASRHFTDTDFNAGTLTNTTVNGTGGDAVVELVNGSTFNKLDTVDDGNRTTHWPLNESSGASTFSDFEGTADLTNNGGTAGETGIEDNSVDFEEDNSEDASSSDINAIDGASEFTVVAWVNAETLDDASTIVAKGPGGSEVFALTFDTGGSNNWNFEVRDSNGNFKRVSSSSNTSTGQWILVAGVYDNGNVELYTNGTLESSDTQGSSLNSNSNGVFIGSKNGSSFWDGRIDDVRTYTTALNASQLQELHDNPSVNTENTPGTYISANHTVEDSEQGFVNITTLTNASATVTWETNDGSGWSTLNETSGITSAANHTFTWSVESNDTVRVNVTVFNQSGNGDPDFEMADEGVQFTANDTDVDNSSATPTGDLSTSTPTLEIDINDSDFNLSQDDTVTVEFFIDGVSIGTDTLTSNGTASVMTDTLNGGDHTWNVTANDTYSHSTTSQDFTITVPSNLTVREERPVHPKIDQVSVTAKFFEQGEDEPTIVNRTTNDGNISLDGLPVGSEFTVTISAPGYHNRTVLLDDIFTQSTVFLLNETGQDNDITFTIEDPTGEFTDEDSEILVKRSINESIYNDTGGFSYLIVEGDEIGASGEIETTLETDERYRLVVRSDDETRILGGFVPESDKTVTLRPSPPSINVTDEQGYAWNASTDETANTITFEYNDPDDNTTDLELIIHEQNNASNEIYNQTHAGPHGYLKVTQTLTDEQANETWVVKYSAQRGGDTISGQTGVGRQVITQLPELDDTWKNAVAVIMVILTGGLFSVRNAETGAVATAFVGGGFWMGGWLPTAAGGAIMVGMVVAVVWKSQAGRFG